MLIKTVEDIFFSFTKTSCDFQIPNDVIRMWKATILPFLEIGNLINQ